MQPHKIWRYFCEPLTTPGRTLACRLLAEAGLEAAPEIPSTREIGVVFYERDSDGLCDFLRENSNGGLNRVLAVSLAARPPTSAETWRLLQAGAADVLAAAPDAGARLAARLARWQAVETLLHSPLVQNNLVGRSAAWRRVLRQTIEIARFTDASLLVTGESGTGKEQIARLVHTLDEKRNKRSLVVLDCATVQPELSGSEFFGHERGAFTGAASQRDGAFARADGGTLFLDEIGELPLKLQAELLRAVQERTYKRVGGNAWHKADFRLVCATNRDLLDETAAGRFRSDLYYRIAAWTCRLPPLRERADDVLPLAQHFLQEAGLTDMDGAVREYLLQRDYPGNVRELGQLVKRMIYRHAGAGPLTAGDIPEDERPAEFAATAWPDEHFAGNIRRALLLGANLKEITELAETTAERLVLEEENDNVARAAARLGVHRRTLEMHRAAWRQNDGYPA
jgi:transcriptional regulator with GAF, ATPase, and Fis domain